MSRSGDGDYDDYNFPNEWAFWDRRTRQVLSSRNGFKALTDLREALLALPEKRLIERALSTVGKESVVGTDADRYGEVRELLEEQGSGVCAVGAYAWHQRVKAGMDPQEAFESLPLAPDYDGDSWRTVEVGKEAGMKETLAWLVMSTNDDRCEGMTPEARYESVLRWVDEKLAAFPEKARA